MTVTGGRPTPTTIVQSRCLPSGTVKHALQIAEALRAAGLGCDIASLDQPVPTAEVPGSLQLIEQVSCDVGDDDVSVTLSSGNTVDLTVMRLGACFVNKTHPGNLTYVKGSNWIIGTQTEATARRIADRFHVFVETFHC